jgi:hypothetical protein
MCIGWILSAWSSRSGGCVVVAPSVMDARDGTRRPGPRTPDDAAIAGDWPGGLDLGSALA